MSGMLERIARAICRANCSPSMDADAVECQVHGAWDMWLGEARAAVEEMREPTRGMLSAGSDEIDYSDFAGKLPSDGLAAAWSRMVGEAIVGVQDEFDALAATTPSGMGGWQPIETAPRDGTKFLAGRFVKNGSHNNLMAVDRWHARDRGDDWDGPGKFNTHYWPATHWQPLPAPPLPPSAPTDATSRSGQHDAPGILGGE